MSLLIMEEKQRLAELPIAAGAGGIPVVARLGPSPEPIEVPAALLTQPE